MQALNDNCRPYFQDYLVQIQNAQKDSSEKESIIVIYDNLISASTFPAIKIIPQLHQESRIPVQDSMLQEIVSELHPLRYKDLPFIGLPIQEMLQLVKMIMPRTPPSAYMWNTLEFLEPSALTQIRDNYQVPIFTVGPLHIISPTPSSTSFLEEDTSCISWLDKQAPKSVVYVSLGSIVKADEKVLTEMAWGLANSKQPFLWVVRLGLVKGFEWIEFLPKGLVSEMKGRGMIVKWAPQKEVLAHFAVGGFWSHCGWNSTMESMFEGVPMLCHPFDADQKVNSRYLSYVWKMGVEIVTERGEIEGVIKRLLVSKEGEEMKQRAMEIQEKVKGAINHGGSSYNSLKKLVEIMGDSGGQN
ncbi:hypothetical protein M8C21_000521, partial [Ambrosia artemisiifolia]